jgi:hypothetical protein
VYEEPRFASFLVIPFMVLVAVGAVGVVSALPRPRHKWPAAAVLVLACGFVGVRLIQRTVYENRYPIENFKGATAVVHRTGVRFVVSNDTQGAGLRYYLGRVAELQASPAALVNAFCHLPAPLVYVDAPFESTEPQTTCLRDRGAYVVRLHQRERGGHIDVWVLPRRR